MNELNLLFEKAVRVQFQPPTGQYGMPIIGIAFANGTLPKRVSEILNSRNTSYDLVISLNPIAFSVKVLDFKTKEEIFIANLNYEEAEVESFRNLINDGDKGAFVVGGFSNCQYYVITNDQDSFKPFAVESISFVDLETKTKGA